MRIGILSDTHGRLPAAKAAMELLVSAGCETFIHCGDVGSCDILDLLAGLPSYFVFGNTDYDGEALRQYSQTIGVRCLGSGGVIRLEKKKLAVTHGDDAEKLRAILADEPDYLFTGHTHIAKDIRQGKTRWINPGALQRAAVKSVAVLDLTNDRLEFLQVHL
jgi:putative phosphoesterase